jgi:hypothetical protein
MTDLVYDKRLALEVEKELIRLHPLAEYIRVNPSLTGLVAEVRQEGKYLDVGAEMIAFINKKLRAVFTIQCRAGA